MLVLSRKNNQSVIVGGTSGLDSAVRVTVLEIDRGHVKLGFEAKKEVSVYREEVWEQIVADRPTGTLAAPLVGLDRWTDDCCPEVRIS